MAWSPPTAFADKPVPGTGRGEDLADSLGIASQGTQRHVPVLGRQHHLFDGGHLVAGELAMACARTRRPVSERTRIFRSSPGVVPPRFEADDTQDDGQGKERFGAGDCAKNAGFRVSLWEPASGEAEPGSTKQGEQQTNNSGKNSRPLLPTCAGIARVLPILVERFRRDDRDGGRVVARSKRWNAGSERAWQRPSRRSERRVRADDDRRRGVYEARSRLWVSSQKDHRHFGKPQ